MDEFDYVIVGAGSAGYVIATRLSEDPSISICVLEAGSELHRVQGFAIHCILRRTTC